MTQLTEIQQKALALNKNISVTAGAGSGKTRILVERFLSIVLKDPRLTRHILAITFTNKAAGEMQQRLTEAVNHRLTQTSDGDEKKRLLSVRDQLNSAAISTIHSFCARTLREFPLEAGLSPEFSELDEMRSKLLILQAVEESFHLLDEEPKEDWLPLFHAINRQTLAAMLNRALHHPFEMQQITERMAAMDEEHYRRFLEESWLRMNRQELDHIDFEHLYRIARSLSTARPVAMASAKGQQTLDALQNYVTAFGQNPDSIQTKTTAIQLIIQFTTQEGTPYKNLAQLGGKNSWSGKEGQQLLELSEQCATYTDLRCIKNKFFLTDARADAQWFHHFKRFLLLYRKADEKYEEQKIEESALDFEDLQLKTIHLLRNNEAVRRELAERYRYIMVDEFQDTNELQWQIISLLSKEEGQFSRDKVFIVGDPKQSIYGFRNADIRIFRQAREMFARLHESQSGRKFTGNIVFADSFRFLPSLNAFINFMFSEILQEQPSNPFEVGYHPLQAQRTPADSGEAHLAVLPAELPNEATYIAYQIKEIIDGKKTCFEWQGKESRRTIEYGDMAILLRSRGNLLEVEQALRDADIPFHTSKGIGFWQQQEIFDLYYLLRFLQNPQDDLALVALLRSRFFLIPDHVLFFLSLHSSDHYLKKIDEFLQQTVSTVSKKESEDLQHCAYLLHKWLGLRDRMNLNDLLEIIFRDVHLRARLAARLNGEQLLANVDKFIRHVQNFDSAGLGGLTDFIGHINDLISTQLEEGQAQSILEERGSVHIMTIHAAKGLEFPVVFLPYLNQKSGGRGQTVFLDGTLGMAVKLNDLESGEHSLLRLLAEQKRRREMAEAKRIFYVGVTRASNYLYMSAQLNNKNDGITSQTPLEWICNAFTKIGGDILSDQQISGDHFRLDLVHDFTPPDFSGINAQSFFSEIDTLKSSLKQPPTGPLPIPLYLQEVKKKEGSRVFSATRLMVFLEDRQEYYRRYHLGFFESDYQTFSQNIYARDDSILMGKIVHRYLELLLQPGWDETSLLQTIYFDFDIFDPDLQLAIRRELALVREKMEHSRQGRALMQASQARNEQTVLMKLGKHYFTGTIDRLFRNKQNLWEVVDYKTNHIHAQAVPRVAARYEWQMQTYALMVSNLFPQQTVFPVSLYFLNPDYIFRKEYLKESLQTFSAHLEQIMDEIEAFFPIEPGKIE